MGYYLSLISPERKTSLDIIKHEAAVVRRIVQQFGYWIFLKMRCLNVVDKKIQYQAVSFFLSVCKGRGKMASLEGFARKNFVNSVSFCNSVKKFFKPLLRLALFRNTFLISA